MSPAQVAHITPPLPFAVFDEFGQGCEDRVADHYRAAVEAALRDAPQQAEGWVMVPADVVKFLTGEGPLDGLWFGEHPFGLGGGKYWWRKHLHAARPSAPTAVEPDERAAWKLETVLAAAREWSAERMPNDWCEADLMKAIIDLEGDWPGCDECDHQCDEPCAPATVAEMHARIDNHIADLVHAGKLGAYIGYTPPAGWTPTIRIKRAARASKGTPL